MPYTDEHLPFTGTLGLTVATSYEAAEKMAGKAGTKRRNVLVALSHHPKGLTDKELQALLHMGGSTERPRRIELHRAKLIHASGDRHVHGTRQVVWSLTALGEIVVAGEA
jgi:hypothetical protein